MPGFEKAETLFHDLIERGIFPRDAFELVKKECALDAAAGKRFEQTVENLEKIAKVVSKYSDEARENPKDLFGKIFGVDLGFGDVVVADVYLYGISFSVASLEYEKLAQRLGFSETQKAAFFPSHSKKAKKFFRIKELLGAVSVSVYDLRNVKKAKEILQKEHLSDSDFLKSDEYVERISAHEERHAFQSLKGIYGADAKTSIELQIAKELAAVIASGEKVTSERLENYVRRYVSEAREILQKRAEKEKSPAKEFSHGEIERLPKIEESFLSVCKANSQAVEPALKKMRKEEIASFAENTPFSVFAVRINSKIRGL